MATESICAWLPTFTAFYIAIVMCKERTTKLTICNTDGSCFSIASLWHLPSLFSAFSARRSLWTFHWFCLALSIETWPSFGAAWVVDICGNVWENGRTTPINFFLCAAFFISFSYAAKKFSWPQNESRVFHCLLSYIDSSSFCLHNCIWPYTMHRIANIDEQMDELV